MDEEPVLWERIMPAGEALRFLRELNENGGCGSISMRYKGDYVKIVYQESVNEGYPELTEEELARERFIFRTPDTERCNYADWFAVSVVEREREYQAEAEEIRTDRLEELAEWWSTKRTNEQDYHRAINVCVDVEYRGCCGTDKNLLVRLSRLGLTSYRDYQMLNTEERAELIEHIAGLVQEEQFAEYPEERKWGYGARRKRPIDPKEVKEYVHRNLMENKISPQIAYSLLCSLGLAKPVEVGKIPERKLEAEIFTWIAGERFWSAEEEDAILARGKEGELVLRLMHMFGGKLIK